VRNGPGSALVTNFVLICLFFVFCFFASNIAPFKTLDTTAWVSNIVVHHTLEEPLPFPPSKV
jgi:hypothetical protein